jgi:hypothetical protein
MRTYYSIGEIERLRSENARLREALRAYVNTVLQEEGVSFLDRMPVAELRAVIEAALAKHGEK